MANPVAPTTVLSPSLDTTGLVAARHGENVPSGSGSYTFVQGPSVLRVQTGGIVMGTTPDDVYVQEHVPDDGRTFLYYKTYDRDNSTAGGVILGIK